MQPILKYSPDLLQSLGRIGVDGVIRALPLCSAPSIPSTARAPAPEVEFCSVSQACWRRFSPSDSSPSRTLPASTSSFSLPRSFLLSNSLATATTTNHAIGSSVFVRSYAKLHKNIYRPTFKLPPEVKEVADATFKEYKSKKLPEPRAPPLVHRELKNASRRVGCIAVKVVGLQTPSKTATEPFKWAQATQSKKVVGLKTPERNGYRALQVVGLKTPKQNGYQALQRNGYRALQVGSGYAKQKSLDGAKAGFYISQGVPFKEHLVEFQVSSDAVLPVGTHITAAHYVPGQHVDIAGWTKDKGFQVLPVGTHITAAHYVPGQHVDIAGWTKDKGFKGMRKRWGCGSARLTWSLPSTTELPVQSA
eukprot:gene18536-25042_t